MEDSDLDLWCSFVYSSVKLAQTVRETHRNRTKRTDPSRNVDIANAQSRLKRAMRPIRSELAKISKQIDKARAEQDSVLAGRLSTQRITLHELSYRLQTERRKLWKMSNRKHPHGKRRRKN